MAPDSSSQRHLVVAMIVARLLDPQSKLATARGLNAATLAHTLGEQLGLQVATDEGEPMHSFQTLLSDLATIVKNRIEPKVLGAKPFDQTTRPTLLQQRALDLLQVRLYMYPVG